MTNDKYIDLHLHLDGAITPEIAVKLAEIQNIPLPTEDEAELTKLLRVPENCRSLNDFLSCFALPVSLMQTYEGLKEAAFSVAEDMNRQGVIYGEIRFAPQLHTQKGLSQEDAVNAVLDGVKASSLKANIILCCMRGKDNEKENAETAEIARRYLKKDGGVVALDLAGAEALFPTADYRELFNKAAKYGIPFTIHAGEADGAESVRLAVEYGACRIGHGVRAFEDETVLKTVIEKGIFFEMCPTSNRQTAAVPDMSAYPIKEYLKKGVKVTVNTDDPAIEGTEIKNEFLYLKNTFGLTDEDVKTVLQNSVDAAFTTAEVKEDLKRRLGL